VIASAAALALAGGDARADELAWGTYFGGEAGDYINGISVDPAGNIYVGGQTDSVAGIATPGAYRTAPQKLDGFLAKFTPAGELLWATYFGGPGEDWVRDVVVRGDSVVIAGETYSDTGIAYGDTFQTKGYTFHNGFVAQFTADGAILWGTYIHTYLVVDGLAIGSLAVGPQNELYVAGSTIDNPGLTTPDAHQPVFSGGGQQADGYLLRLDETGNRVWATYYGGHGKDTAMVVTRGDSVYLGGFTQSSGAIATPGTFQPDAPDDDEKFGAMYAARFDAAGVRAWGTYFGSDVGKDFGSMAAHPDGGVVLGGASQKIDVGQSTDMSEPLGSDDVMMVRFDDTGARVWSRYFGGPDSEGVNDVEIDELGTIHVIGYGSSDNLATLDGFHTMSAGAGDLFMARFDGSGVQTYGTYIGGEANDVYGRLMLAPQRVLVGGRTRSLTGIATPGAHQTTYNLGMEDGVHGDAFLWVFGAGAGAGQPCDDGDACQSGFCSDEVCCDAACGDSDAGDCQACSVAAGAAVDGTCGPRAPGPCRPAVDECDAAEACDGVALECPADDVVGDGAPCPEGACAAGMCVTGETTGTTTNGAEGTGAATEVPGGSTSTGDETGPVPTSDAAATAQEPASSSGDATGAENPTDTGCGCASTNAPALLAALLLLPRRRKAAAPTTRRSHRPVHDL